MSCYLCAFNSLSLFASVGLTIWLFFVFVGQDEKVFYAYSTDFCLSVYIVRQSRHLVCINSPIIGSLQAHGPITTPTRNDMMKSQALVARNYPHPTSSFLNILFTYSFSIIKKNIKISLLFHLYSLYLPCSCPYNHTILG